MARTNILGSLGLQSQASSLEKQYNLPSGLLGAQVQQEGGYNPTTGVNNYSSTGAFGLAQVLPSTARDPGYGVSPISMTDAADPSKALTFMAQYDAGRIAAVGGDANKGLLAYSGGAYSADSVMARYPDAASYGNDNGGTSSTAANDDSAYSYASAASANGTTTPATDATGSSSGAATTLMNTTGTTQAANSAGFSPGAASGNDIASAQQGIPADTPTAIVTGDNQVATQAKNNQAAADKTATANTKSATQTATGIYTWAQAALGDTVFRIGLVAIGLVVLAGALYMIAEEQNVSPSLRSFARQSRRAVVKKATGAMAAVAAV